MVYNPTTLDLTIVVPGVTTGFDVNGLLVQVVEQFVHHLMLPVLHSQSKILQQEL
ncbi:MAG: hypothetical protein IPP34_07125 [Bacteroidetes bacterium]|nr:hypothetical protein [Bacteroidota bacterium]